MQLLVADKIEVIFNQCSVMGISILLTALGDINVSIKLCSCPINNTIHIFYMQKALEITSVLKQRLYLGTYPLTMRTTLSPRDIGR